MTDSTGQASIQFHYSPSDESPLMLLPPPSFGIPASRPYTAATMVTYVDPDAELPVPPVPHLGMTHSDSSQVSRASERLDAEPPEQEGVPQMSLIPLTFLLVSGRRRSMTFEPDTTVGRVKELVWNAWPSEWQDERPPAPSYLRILYLGKILQDDDTLTKLSFPSFTPPALSLQSQSSSTAPLPTTIVHLSIRPYGLPSDNDALKKKRKRKSLGVGAGGQGGAEGDGEEASGGCYECWCRCVIC